MPTATITLPDGRRARLTGPTREAVMAQARSLVQPTDPEAPPYITEQDIANIGQPLEVRRGRPTRAPVTLPFGLGQFSVGGSASNLVRAASNVEEETSLQIAGAIAGSALSGPVMTGAAARGLVAPIVSKMPAGTRIISGGLLRNSARFGPATVGAAIGGGGLPAANVAREGGTPEEIADTFRENAIEAGAAELVGLGAGSLLTGLTRPATTSVMAGPIGRPINKAAQRLNNLSTRARAFVARAPSEARTAAAEIARRYPTERAAARAASERLSDLVRTTTRTVNGQRVIHQPALNAAWQALPATTRAGVRGGFMGFRKGIETLVRVGRTTAAKEAAKELGPAAAGLAFGPAGFAIAYGARTLLDPGLLIRWLGSDALPDPLTRFAVREGLLATRALDEEDED